MESPRGRPPRAPPALPGCAPCGRPGLARNPLASGSPPRRASKELSVVLGERSRRGRSEERRRVEKQNARLAEAVHAATLTPTETFRIQLEEGEGESPF